MSAALLRIVEMLMDQKERRKGVRTTPKGHGEPGWIDAAEKRLPVLVVDESVGGMGILAINWPDIPIGSQVRFSSNLRNVEGRIASVRHVTIAGTRVFRVGLEWSD